MTMKPYKISKKQKAIINTYPCCILPLSIIHSKDLTWNDKGVYMIIFAALMKGKPFTRSNKYIAKQCGLSRMTVQRSIKHLVNKGYIHFNYTKGISKNGHVYIKGRYIPSNRDRE